MTNDLRILLHEEEGDRRKEGRLVLERCCFVEDCDEQSLAAVLDPGANQMSLVFRVPGCLPTVMTLPSPSMEPLLCPRATQRAGSCHFFNVHNLTKPAEETEAGRGEQLPKTPYR